MPAFPQILLLDWRELTQVSKRVRYFPKALTFRISLAVPRLLLSTPAYKRRRILRVGRPNVVVRTLSYVIASRGHGLTKASSSSTWSWANAHGPRLMGRCPWGYVCVG